VKVIFKKAKNLINSATSINKIRNYLISKGIQDRYIKETINKINENNSEKGVCNSNIYNNLQRLRKWLLIKGLRP